MRWPKVRTISILELGRVVDLRMCPEHGPEIYVRGERTKTIYMAFPGQVVTEDDEEKPYWLEVGQRVVIEQCQQAAGFRISEWHGADDHRPIYRFDMKQLDPLLGPCFEV